MSRALPIKVCFVMPVAERLGGAEKMLWLFLRDVDRDVITPSVIFLADGPFVRDCAAISVATEVVRSGRVRSVKSSLATVRDLTRVFRATQPDLIVEWFGKTHVWVSPAAHASGLGSRVIWWQHSVSERGLLSYLTRLLPARAVGAESAAAADIQAGLWPRRPTFVVHSGIEGAERGGREQLRQQTRAELGVSDDEVLIGMISRVQRWKGQHRLLEAISRLRARGIVCRGLLVGGDAYGLDRAYNAEIRQLLSQLGLEGIVTWIDQVADAQPYLEALDVFVNASIGENLSLALLEAMAAERCIVAVADGGTPEVIIDGKNGILYQENDADHLSDALAGVACDAELRSRLGRSARNEFERRFTAEGWTRTLQSRLLLISTDGYRDALPSVGREPRSVPPATVRAM
jgi:glycosyltransferase involved in cell wall biosynthesis